LFKIDNYGLANTMVLNCLKRIIDMKTFGSGWSIFKMDLPELKVISAGYVLFFDSTHIGLSDV
jgi:hypothetical protein